MPTDATPRWALPQIFAGQAQKELFHNEALSRIDMLLHGQVESADSAVPPIDPEPGACWIVAAGASGAWAGQEDVVACWTEGGWRFVTPRAGISLWVSDRGHAMQHDGTAWKNFVARDDGLYIDDERIVGPRLGPIADPTGGGAADTEARAAVTSILAALRNHGLIET